MSNIQVLTIRPKAIALRLLSRSFVFMLLCVAGLSSAQQQPEDFQKKLDLGAAMRMAIQSNPQVLSSIALSRSADEGVRAAKWGYFPTPSISIEQVAAAPGDPSYVPSGKTQVLRLQQPLFTWGRLKSGVDKSEALKDVSEAALADVRQQIALRVAQAYSEWMASTLKVGAYKDGLIALQRFENLISRRIAVGVATRGDMLLVQGRQSQMRSELMVAEAQVQVQRSKLAQLIGRPVETQPVPFEKQKDITDLFRARDILELAIKNAPSLAKARAQARSIELEASVRRASLLPEIYLRVERQTGSLTLQNSRTQGRAFIGMSSNFGSGLSAGSEISAINERYRSALQEVESAERSLDEQVSSDILTLSSFQGRKTELLLASDYAMRLLSSSERQFLAGRKSWQDLLNVSREFVQAKVQLAEINAGRLQLSWRLLIFVEPLDRVMELVAVE